MFQVTIAPDSKLSPLSVDDEYPRCHLTTRVPSNQFRMVIRYLLSPTFLGVHIALRRTKHHHFHEVLSLASCVGHSHAASTNQRPCWLHVLGREFVFGSEGWRRADSDNIGNPRWCSAADVSAVWLVGYSDLPRLTLLDGAFFSLEDE